MYREIITPNIYNNMIQIPKEYWNQEVEILVLPFSKIKKSRKKDKKNLKKLLNISCLDIEEVRIKNWEIERF